MVLLVYESGEKRAYKRVSLTSGARKVHAEVALLRGKLRLLLLTIRLSNKAVTKIYTRSTLSSSTITSRVIKVANSEMDNE